MATLVFLGCFLAAAAAYAHPVLVDPGDFGGQWAVPGVPFASGPRTVDLPTGSTYVTVGAAGGIPITVSSSGVVTVIEPASATGGAGTLTFHTVDVAIDTAAYDGQWKVDRGEPGTFVTGDRIATFVPGVWFTVVTGGEGGFTVVADASGAVDVLNGVSATSGPGTLTFNTVDITVDPAAFDGQWRVSRGEPGTFVTGSRVATFVPGVLFQIGVGSDGSLFLIPDASGGASVVNTGAAVSTPGRLTFNTVDITIDPAAFDGQWVVPNGEPGVFGAGVRVATFVPNVLAQIGVGSNGSVFIVPDAAGYASVLNGISATSTAGRLTFNTVDVLVDPAAYAGEWLVSRGEPAAYGAGPRVATMVPGAMFQVVVGSDGFFFVTPDVYGNVTVFNGVSATSVPGTLTFNTSAIQIDPGAYLGSWYVSRAGSGTLPGVRSTQLVSGLSYRVVAGSASQVITVGSPCSVSPSSFTLAGFAFSGSCGCADGDEDGVCDAVDACPLDPANDADADGVCGNADLCSGNDAAGDSDGDGTCDDIDPCFGDDLTGDVDFDGVCNDRDACAGLDATGDADADGICDSDDLCLGDDHAGDADADAVCDDRDLCVGADASGDSDGDGTCDDSDVCPLDPLDDEDGDGICGNVDACIGDDSLGDSDGDDICDDRDFCVGADATGDVDGDGYCSDTDNCPADANPSQADADHDGLGDACEADTDADGVIDDLDDCPTRWDPDQSDTDGDHEGDACDLDDDGDGVADVADNCPLYANPDQTDGDGDGYGDACDGDDDADGVGDDVDLCPGTPLASLFDDQGCSGAQRIELACGLPGVGPHGAYVSCVTREATRVRRLGLITEEERARLVRDAARGAVAVPRNQRRAQ